jgi:hypothetical protein
VVSLDGESGKPAEEALIEIKENIGKLTYLAATRRRREVTLLGVESAPAAATLGLRGADRCRPRM